MLSIFSWFLSGNDFIMSLQSGHSLLEYFISLHHFAQDQNLGRYRLAEYLGLTKDQTRPIIQYLVDKKLIEKISQREGHCLSQLGREYISKCQNYIHISPIHVFFGSDFTVGSKDAVVCLEATEIEQLNTVVLRDEALLAGSKGCTVFFQESKKEIFLLNVIYPPLPSSPLSSRKVKKRIQKVTQDLLWEKIVVIVGTADTFPLAQKGAVAAGLLFLPGELKRPLLP